METYLHGTAAGERTAFEIENIYVSRKTVGKILKNAHGVTDVQVTSPFHFTSDNRVEFKYRGRDYIVWEPYGDNSRYWIGPKNPDRGASEITELEEAFKQYRPPAHRALLGEILTLHFLRRLAGRN